MSNISRRRMLAVFASAGVAAVAAVPLVLQAPAAPAPAVPAAAVSADELVAKYEAWRTGPREFVATGSLRD